MLTNMNGYANILELQTWLVYQRVAVDCASCLCKYIDNRYQHIVLETAIMRSFCSKEKAFYNVVDWLHRKICFFFYPDGCLIKIEKEINFENKTKIQI